MQIIDERHQQLVRDIDAQRANLDEEKRQLDEDRRRIGVAGAIAGPPPRCVPCQNLSSAVNYTNIALGSAAVNADANECRFSFLCN